MAAGSHWHVLLEPPPPLAQPAEGTFFSKILKTERSIIKPGYRTPHEGALAGETPGAQCLSSK